jgi:hypothetical protein
MVGAWHLRTDGPRTTVVIGVARPLAPDDEAAVRSEADAMLEFSRPRSMNRAVEISIIRPQGTTS